MCSITAVWQGNNLYLSLGNIAANPRAGLLFINRETGEICQKSRYAMPPVTTCLDRRVMARKRFMGPTKRLLKAMDKFGLALFPAELPGCP